MSHGQTHADGLSNQSSDFGLFSSVTLNIRPHFYCIIIGTPQGKKIILKTSCRHCHLKSEFDLASWGCVSFKLVAKKNCQQCIKSYLPALSHLLCSIFFEYAFFLNVPGKATIDPERFLFLFCMNCLGLEVAKSFYILLIIIALINNFLTLI